MRFGRRKPAHLSRDPKARDPKPRDTRARDTSARDPFGHLADERRAAESEAWFLQPDDAPEIDVQAGISSNLSGHDLGEGAAGRPAGTGDPHDAAGDR
jgi:hypothetical protein